VADREVTMSENTTGQSQVLMIVVPRWLNWRFVGLIFLISVAVLILALLWADRGNSPPSSDVLYGRIRDVAHLSTVEYKLSTVVQVINPRGIWGDEKLVYGVCGRVVAGIDLDKFSKEDVQVDGSHIRITLPEAEIFTVDIILENDVREVPEHALETSGRTAEVHSECAETIIWDVPPGRPRSPELIADAQEEALKAFKRTAAENRIEAEAQKNAQDLLKKWFERLDFETVEFETTLKLELPQE
jgi:hypothetical protein